MWRTIKTVPVLSLCCCGYFAIHLEMISLLPKTIPIAPALPWTEPALNLAAKMVNQTYGQRVTMSVKLIYNVSHKSCPDADGGNPQALAEYYYTRNTDDCLAIVGSSKWSCFTAILPVFVLYYDLVNVHSHWNQANRTKVKQQARGRTWKKWWNYRHE